MKMNFEADIICPEAPGEFMIRFAGGSARIRRDCLSAEQKDALAAEWRKKLDETQSVYRGASIMPPDMILGGVLGNGPESR